MVNIDRCVIWFAIVRCSEVIFIFCLLFTCFSLRKVFSYSVLCVSGTISWNSLVLIVCVVQRLCCVNCAAFLQAVVALAALMRWNNRKSTRIHSRLTSPYLMLTQLCSSFIDLQAEFVSLRAIDHCTKICQVGLITIKKLVIVNFVIIND